MNFDYLVVGSGLTGATIARHLVDGGYRVQVVDRRSYIGETLADRVHESGIIVGLHGPHFFRTDSESVWRFVNRFGAFHTYRAIVRTQIDGRLENWPIAEGYIRRTLGKAWKPDFTGMAMNFEEAALAMMPRAIYDRFIKGYTEKQWGVPANTLSSQLCRRLDVRANDDPYLTPHATFQGIPTAGYSAWLTRMLEGVRVDLNINYLSDRRAFRPRNLTIYTGPIDEYFNFSLGRLSYRGHQRTTKHLVNDRRVLPCAQVNHPDLADGQKVRTIEWKHLMRRDLAGNVRGTVVTEEVPFAATNPMDFECPVPDETNEDLYMDYSRLAQQESSVLFCGRLGEYQYYDMDQEISRAAGFARKILTNRMSEAA